MRSVGGRVNNVIDYYLLFQLVILSRMPYVELKISR